MAILIFNRIRNKNISFHNAICNDVQYVLTKMKEDSKCTTKYGLLVANIIY